jgi:hypothetical protein
MGFAYIDNLYLLRSTLTQINILELAALRDASDFWTYLKIYLHVSISRLAGTSTPTQGRTLYILQLYIPQIKYLYS